MRRFSQRNPLVTLSDINITPLLDLAFVLLIIFVITTPLLEQNLRLSLPSGGREEETKPGKNDVKTIEVNPAGEYLMGGRRVSLNEVEASLVSAQQANPKLGVYIRADRKEEFGRVMAVLDRCEKHGILKVAFGTKAEKR